MKHILLLISFFAFFACIHAQVTEQVFEFVEVPPAFGDCTGKDAKELQNCTSQKVAEFLAKNTKYPAVAVENNIQGKVMVQFVVNKDGSISESKVLRDIGGGCGAEALRVVSSMPKWQPGIHNGKPVSVRYTLPFNFHLGTNSGPSEPQFTLYTGKYINEQITKAELQKALQGAPIVRDGAGNAVKIQNLSLTIEGKRNPKTISFAGDMPTKDMIKLVKKAKKGSSAILEAKVQTSGKFYPVQRVWTITD